MRTRSSEESVGDSGTRAHALMETNVDFPMRKNTLQDPKETRENLVITLFIMGEGI